MKSCLIFLMSVASISCHWYNGPYHFVYDVGKPTAISSNLGGDINPIGTDIAGDINPIGTDIDSIRLSPEAYTIGDPTILPTVDSIGADVAGGDTLSVISGKPFFGSGIKTGTTVFIRDGAAIDPIGGYYMSKPGEDLKYLEGASSLYKLEAENIIPYGNLIGQYVPGTKDTKWFNGAENFLHFYKTQHKTGIVSKPIY